jgi:hypothetical protein
MRWTSVDGCGRRGAEGLAARACGWSGEACTVLHGRVSWVPQRGMGMGASEQEPRRQEKGEGYQARCKGAAAACAEPSATLSRHAPNAPS